MVKTVTSGQSCLGTILFTLIMTGGIIYLLAPLFDREKRELQLQAENDEYSTAKLFDIIAREKDSSQWSKRALKSLCKRDAPEITNFFHKKLLIATGENAVDISEYLLGHGETVGVELFLTRLAQPKSKSDHTVRHWEPGYTIISASSTGRFFYQDRPGIKAFMVFEKLESLHPGKIHEFLRRRTHPLTQEARFDDFLSMLTSTDEFQQERIRLKESFSGHLNKFVALSKKRLTGGLAKFNYKIFGDEDFYANWQKILVLNTPGPENFYQQALIPEEFRAQSPDEVDLVVYRKFSKGLYDTGYNDGTQTTLESVRLIGCDIRDPSNPVYGNLGSESESFGDRPRKKNIWRSRTSIPTFWGSNRFVEFHEGICNHTQKSPKGQKSKTKVIANSSSAGVFLFFRNLFDGWHITLVVNHSPFADRKYAHVRKQLSSPRNAYHHPLPGG